MWLDNYTYNNLLIKYPSLFFSLFSNNTWRMTLLPLILYCCFYAFLPNYDDNPSRVKLIQIYSVDWTDVYDAHKHWTQNRTQLAIKVSADN